METNVERVEVFQGRDDQWYFREVAGNNKIVGQSQAYKTKEHALRGAHAKFEGGTVKFEIVEPFLRGDNDGSA